MADLRGAPAAEDQRDDVEPQGAVLDPMGGDEMTGSLGDPLPLGQVDRRLGGAERLVRPRADFDENERAVAVHHDQVQFTQRAGVVADESPQTLILEEPLATSLPPSAEPDPVAQQSASIENHLDELRVDRA